MEVWTAERFEMRALEVLSELMIAGRPRLGELAGELRSAAMEQLTDPPPLDPWADPAVAYGALTGLAEFAEVASRRALSPDILRVVHGSEEDRLALLQLARRPGGMIVAGEDDSTAMGGAQSTRAQALSRLMEIGLVERQSVNGVNGQSTLEVTPNGWVAVDLLERWAPKS